MAFVTGLMGPYMSPIPINSSMGMFISLAIAFVVTPWLAALLAKSAQAAHRGRRRTRRASRPRPSRLERLFRRLLTPFLDARKGPVARRWLLLVIVLLIAGSLVCCRCQAGGAEDAAVRQQERVPGRRRHAGRHAARRNGARAARARRRDRKVPEVSNYQAYAGTASPINFNGLVRQYYLRAAPELGDLQVNLVDKQHRAQEPRDRQSVRDAVEAIGAAPAATPRSSKCRRGRRSCRRSSPRSMGRTTAGRERWPGKCASASKATPDLVAIDDSVNAGGQR
jgi:multidrug efflux pump subunit AcrB